MIGPAKESVVDLPLSAVKTPRKFMFVKDVPLPVSRKTVVPRPTVVPEKPQTLEGFVNEMCVTCVDPAARPVGTATAKATATATASRSNLRYISYSSLSSHPDGAGSPLQQGKKE